MGYKKGYKFNGYHVNVPDIYSKVRSDMVASKENGAKNIAIIGNAKGGIPNEIAFVDDPETAKRLFKGGDLLTACLKAYDPVKDTKVGVELGGADLILAVRANNATKAQSNIYQNKTTESRIGNVIATVNGKTTGAITAGGNFAGNTNKTFKVVITSEGTKNLAEATFNYSLADEEEFAKEVSFKLSDTSNVKDKELKDGLTISFGEGLYSKGDTFLIPCYAAVDESEFVYTIESKDYGKDCNMISHKLDDGENKGTKKLTVYDGKEDEYEVFDNVGGTFGIKYIGESPYAVLSIIGDGKGNAIKFQTKIGNTEDDAIVDLDIELNENMFKSIKNFASYIEGFDQYTTTVVTTMNPDLNVNDFDFMEKVNIKEEVPITAVLRDLKKIGEYQSNLINIDVINKEVANFNNYPYMALEGGSEGQSARSYIEILDKLSKYDIDYIVPLTDDLAIIAEVKEHCLLMSERQGKERRAVVGLGSGLKPGVAISTVKKLANARVQFVGPGFWDYNDIGKLVLYPPYITAAMHAGRAAFLGVEPATADIYNMVKPEYTVDEQTKDEFINNGVLFFEEIVSDMNHKQFLSRLVWDYTTYTEENDPLLVERSTGAIADQLSKDLRKDLGKMLTGKLTPTGVLESAKNKAITRLQQYKKDGIILAYQNLRIVKSRDKTNIYVEVAPTQVNNFTFLDILFYNEDIVIE